MEFFSSFIQISHADSRNVLLIHTEPREKLPFLVKYFSMDKQRDEKQKIQILFPFSFQSNPYGLKDSGPTSDMSWTAASLQPTTGYYSPYDPTLAAYG